MPLVCAIYGYEFTKSSAFLGLHFEPRYNRMNDAHQKARDESRYNLTGVVILDEYRNDQIFSLEAVLSFIEHLDVIISEPLKLQGAPYFSHFPEIARTADRYSGGGAVLPQDGFYPGSRPAFIRLALMRLADDTYCETSGYRTLFFKTAESFRQRKPFVEVSYYMLFSGLETYVRKTLGEPSKPDVAALIAKRLKQLGFNIHTYREDDLKRSTDTYARLRNALFHMSDYEATRRLKDGTVVRYKLFDYYSNFRILVSFVVLKATEFDDPQMNWDGWINMQN